MNNDNTYAENTRRTSNGSPSNNRPASTQRRPTQGQRRPRPNPNGERRAPAQRPPQANAEPMTRERVEKRPVSLQTNRQKNAVQPNCEQVRRSKLNSSTGRSDVEQIRRNADPWQIRKESFLSSDKSRNAVSVSKDCKHSPPSDYFCQKYGTRIDVWTFRNCTALTEITIPDSVTSIDNSVFEGCDNLTVKCKAGSYAEPYCKDVNINYTTIG